MAKRPHKKLDAWLKVIELTVETYRQTEKLSGDEKFGLISQMRRSAVSVASNIAKALLETLRKTSLGSCTTQRDRFLNLIRK